MITERNTIIKIKSDNLSGNGVLSVKSERKMVKIRFVAIESSGREDGFSFPCDGNVFSGNFKIAKPRLWSIENPELYRFRILIKYGEDAESEKAEGVFAFRKIKSENGKFYLNGKRIFVRGYIPGLRRTSTRITADLTKKNFIEKISARRKDSGLIS